LFIQKSQKKNNSSNENIYVYLSWFAIFIPFFIGTYRHSSELNPNSAFTLSKIVEILNLEETGLDKGLLILSVKILFLLTPLFLLTVYELSLKKDGQKAKLSQTSFGRIKDSIGYKFADVWYFILTLLRTQFSFLFTLMTLGLATINKGISSWFHSLYTDILPTQNNEFSSILVVLIAILISDLALYVEHRVAHEVAFIWDLHEFHHSATEMTILCRDRGSPLQAIFTAPIVLPFTVLNGLLINEFLTEGRFIPVILYSALMAMDYFFAVIGHSSIEMVFPKPFSYIFMSPQLHWLHHSTNPNHYNCNYGQKFPYWDMLFGTYLDESHLKDIQEFGVTNTEYNKHHPLYSYICLPVLKLLKRVKKRDILGWEI
tara:strand:+ start:4848 stop:5966 length:1119 start_codon:yes stop_codon:yes gene_type:complete